MPPNSTSMTECGDVCDVRGQGNSDPFHTKSSGVLTIRELQGTAVRDKDVTDVLVLFRKRQGSDRSTLNATMERRRLAPACWLLILLVMALDSRIIYIGSSVHVLGEWPSLVPFSDKLVRDGIFVDAHSALRREARGAKPQTGFRGLPQSLARTATGTSWRRQCVLGVGESRGRHGSRSFACPQLQLSDRLNPLGSQMPGLHAR